MRSFFLPVLLSSLSIGCATQPAGPREYLDEATAATITAVAQPWILASERLETTIDQRDFLSLYALDVNRVGEHRQYLAVLQWWPLAASAQLEREAVLELKTEGHAIQLRPTLEAARELGIAQPLAQAYTPTAKWWYFPVDKQVLAAFAQARDLRATLALGERRFDYSPWRDGSTELAELTAVLP